MNYAENRVKNGPASLLHKLQITPTYPQKGKPVILSMVSAILPKDPETVIPYPCFLPRK